MKVFFEEVSVKATRKWIDCNGKKRQETKKFYQTINPFNKNTDGTVKNYTQIMEEICAKGNEWMKL